MANIRYMWRPSSIRNQVPLRLRSRAKRIPVVWQCHSKQMQAPSYSPVPTHPCSSKKGHYLLGHTPEWTNVLRQFLWWWLTRCHAVSRLQNSQTLVSMAPNWELKDNILTSETKTYNACVVRIHGPPATREAQRRTINEAKLGKVVKRHQLHCLLWAGCYRDSGVKQFRSKGSNSSVINNSIPACQVQSNGSLVRS